MLIENVIKASDISGKAGAGPVSVSPETTLLDVTQVLAGNKMGVVLVLDTADKVIGVLSERDIIASIAKHGEKALQMPAMTRAA